jgi:hypothetical protein
LLQKSLCFLVHLPTRQWQRVGHGAVTKFGTPTPDGVAMCGWIFLIQSPPFWMIQRCFNPDSIPWKITRKNIIKKISKLKDKLVYWHDPVVSHLSSPTEPSDGLARFFGVCCRMCSTWAPSWVGALVGGHHHPKQDQKPLYKLYIYTYIYIVCDCIDDSTNQFIFHLLIIEICGKQHRRISQWPKLGMVNMVREAGSQWMDHLDRDFFVHSGWLHKDCIEQYFGPSERTSSLDKISYMWL